MTRLRKQLALFDGIPQELPKRAKRPKKCLMDVEHTIGGVRVDHFHKKIILHVRDIRDGYASQARLNHAVLEGDIRLRKNKTLLQTMGQMERQGILEPHETGWRLTPAGQDLAYWIYTGKQRGELD